MRKVPILKKSKFDFACKSMANPAGTRVRPLYHVDLILSNMVRVSGMDLFWGKINAYGCLFSILNRVFLKIHIAATPHTL